MNGTAVADLKVERVKIGWGEDNALQDVTAGSPLPVTMTGQLTALAALLSAVDGLEGKDYATQATLTAVLARLNASLAVTGPLTDAQLRDLPIATVPATAGDVAGTLTDGRKTVPTPGTAVALGAPMACRWVTVTALLSNTQQVNIGGSGVLATAGGSTGTPLEQGAGMTLPVDDVSKVFVDARVAGEGVSFTVAA
ncbi:MAG: hypothetical protein LC798_15615 [Chloroflexi bacterium]|nr:hypothetical protein [Chloroflexota bacterium]